MSEASSERNLALAILGLQTSMIRQADLLSAFNIWMEDKSRSLLDILVEQEKLSVGQCQQIEAIAAEQFRNRDKDTPKDQTAPFSSPAVGIELPQLPDPARSSQLAETVTAVAAQDTDPYRTLSTDNSDRPDVSHRFPTSDSRFRVIRFHAKGGLGQVSLAIDEEVYREVALKEIQPRLADQQSARDRFVREAEITGQLEHPGVVPVYGMGIYADGRPYYAMRFIRGENLMSHIKAFHSSGQVDFRSRTFRQLLGRFVAVCQAIAYAHSRQVIHRDLKPDNMMLGDFGETLVVDWGLAKSMSFNDSLRSEEGQRSVTLRRSGSEETLDGTALGTPAYMSPEQAAGNHSTSGPATDIYSLGATMYCLLTGRPMFRRNDKEEILRSVQLGHAAAPTSLVSTIPKPLEAICLRATALRPEDRYSSAADIAAEIERWLADEPLSAYRDKFLEKTSRWVRKHPSIVSAATSSLGLLLAASIVIAAITYGFNQSLASVNSSLETANGNVERKNRDLVVSQAAVQREARKATDEARRAKEQLEVSRNAGMTLQLNKASELLGRSPNAAELLLQDVVACPLDLRDVSWRLCMQRVKYLTRTEKWTQGTPSLMRFGPDGKSFLIASYGGEVLLFRNRDDKEPRRIRENNLPVRDAAFSPNGEWVATCVAKIDLQRAPEPGLALIYQVADGKLLQRLEGPADRVRAVAFSPDGKVLATAGDDRIITLWSTESWTVLRKLSGHQSGICSVAFLSSNSLVSASGEFFGKPPQSPAEMFLWSLEGEGVPKNLAKDTPPFELVAFDVLHKLAVTTDKDKIIRLWELPSGCPVHEFRGHESKIMSIALSPDGRELVSSGLAGSDHNVFLESGTGSQGELRIWDLQSRKERLLLRGHPVAITAAAFVPDAHELVSFGLDGAVKWWRTRESIPRATLRIGDREIRAMAVAPKGHLLAASSAVDQKAADKKGKIALWDLRSGKLRQEWEAHSDQIESLAFSTDGKYLASGAQDNFIVIWDAESGKPCHRLKGHSDMITDLAFAAGGKQIVSSSSDKTIRIWDIEHEQALATLKGHAGEISSVAISPSGELLASGDYAGVVRLWSLPSGEPLAIMRGHAGKLWSSVMDISFSPDGQWLASCGMDEQAILWDVASRQVAHKLRGHKGPVNRIAFSNDGHTLASCGFDKEVRLWDVVNGLERTRLGPQEPGITQLKFTSDESGLLLGDASGGIQWLHVGEPPVETRLRGHEMPPIVAARIFPNGKQFVSTAFDRTIRVWDLTTCRTSRSWIAHDSNPTALAVSPDGRRVASADLDGNVKIWDPSNGNLELQFMGRKGSLIDSISGLFGNVPGLISSVAFSPAEHRLAVASMEKDFHVWDLTSGKVSKTFVGHKEMVTSVAYFPDGKRLVSVGADKMLVVWDAETGAKLKGVELEGPILAVTVSHRGDRIVAGLEKDGKGAVWVLDANLENPQRLKSHPGLVCDLSLSLDDSMLASSSLDQTVELADFPSGKLIARLKEHLDLALPMGNSVAITPDGQAVISGGPDNTLQVWRRRQDGAWSNPEPPTELFRQRVP